MNPRKYRMRQFNLETQAWEGVEETKTPNALEYLQSVYRNPAEPEGKRMRAAIESLPYENPRMSAVAVGYLDGNTFAEKLERAIRASDRAKLIEAVPTELDQ
jgi:hypothetical protein